MTVKASNVLSGAPDQLVTGAILSAPLTAATPTDAAIYEDAAPTGFTDSGYVSEEGLTMSLSKSFTNIKEWGGSIVKRILEEFDGTLKWQHLEVNEGSLKNTFGDDNVTVTPATATDGTRIKVAVGADSMPRKKWLFRMKDGNAKIRLYVPDGQVTETDDVAFVSNDAIKLGVTLGTAPDSTGKAIYIYTDDGVVAA